jgi:hypothetical protein
MAIEVYVEETPKRAFASAIDWPGWSRGGRNAEEALATLLTYAPRYAGAIASSEIGFDTPREVYELNVVERLPGDSGTEFGMPSVIPRVASRGLDDAALERLIALLRAVWLAFDGTAEAARGVELRTGPRGGGRDLNKIVAHVFGAERAYLGALGGRNNELRDVHAEEMDVIRKAALDTLRERHEGFEPTPGPRRKKPLWSLRYFVHRSAWHALDHAWEIEDRALA